MTTGIKHDTDKPRHSLLPAGTVGQIVQVLEHGARKYAIDNWQCVPDARTRYFDALHRHVEAWWRGERTDPESGMHHLAHAGCCVLFLLWLDRANEEQQRFDQRAHTLKSACVCGETSFVHEWLIGNKEPLMRCVKCGRVRP